MQYFIKNEDFKLEFSDLGGELKNIRRIADGREYLWNGDPKFWKRSSPVLFPFVGALKDNKFTYLDQDYPMSQHGFARDLVHQLIGQTDDSIVFCLSSDEKTKKVYPFDFDLKTKYELDGNVIKVSWTVKNTGNCDMPFSIGAHPAFLCDLNSWALKFDSSDKDLTYHKINKNGLYTSEIHKLSLVEKTLNLSSEMFNDDALIFENNQAHEVTLLNERREVVLSIKFSSPLFGLWSPAGKDAPFICIEPWYGRCDGENFNGQLSDRDWMRVLKTGDEWSADYKINLT